MGDKQHIYPALLSGGSGTRLWPLSRQSYPKQFTDFIGNESLFQKSTLRLCSSDHLSFAPPLTVTNSQFRFVVGDQLANLGIATGPIIIEPEGKNTAPAILAACLMVAKQDPDAMLLVSPTDHLIEDIDAFHNAIAIGIKSAEAGQIVTFGITPTRPETGFGYMEMAHRFDHEAVPVTRFIEKPDLANAQRLIAQDNYLWNAGIFLFRASDMISAFKAHKPSLIETVSAALDHGTKDLDFFRLDQGSWADCEDISIDYAIMEHITNRSVVPLSCKWNDLGDWDSVWRETGPDENGVATSSNSTAIECENVLLRSEAQDQHLVGLGLKDIIAVAMNDAVLIADKNRSQDVKKVVSTLKDKGVLQAQMFPIDHRPWGWFEVLTTDDGFQVKRIFVKPGASLSLQSHKFRSEHWVVISGTATVTIDDAVITLEQGKSTFIPQQTVHRLQNMSETNNLEIIEIQLGSYLGEDDIIRYDDVYARNSTE